MVGCGESETARARLGPVKLEGSYTSGVTRRCWDGLIGGKASVRLVDERSIGGKNFDFGLLSSSAKATII